MHSTPSAFCCVGGREPDPWSALHGPGTAPAGSPPASRPQPFSPAPSPSAPPRDAARAWGRGQPSRPLGGAGALWPGEILWVQEEQSPWVAPAVVTGTAWGSGRETVDVKGTLALPPAQ